MKNNERRAAIEQIIKCVEYTQEQFEANGGEVNPLASEDTEVLAEDYMETYAETYKNLLRFLEEELNK